MGYSLKYFHRLNTHVARGRVFVIAIVRHGGVDLEALSTGVLNYDVDEERG